MTYFVLYATVATAVCRPFHINMITGGRMTRILALFVSLFLANVCYGQGKITSGNILNYDVRPAVQVGNQPIAFKEEAMKRKLVISIADNGDRNYAYTNGKPFGLFDKFLTRISSRGKMIEPKYRFKTLPGDKIEAGMKWTVSTGWYSGDCGEVKAEYQATAAAGPTVTISTNGKESNVSSLTLSYEGIARDDKGCGSRQSKRTVVYVPELEETVLDEFIALVSSGFLADGYKVELKSLQVGGETYRIEMKN